MYGLLARSEFRFSLAHMNRRSPSRIRFGFSQDFMRQWSNITLAKDAETSQVCERIAFSPAEIDVKLLPGPLMEKR